MKIAVRADIELEGPEGSGYVTWLDVDVHDEGKACASARAAIVHVGEIADARGDIWPALHETPLELLHDVYFSEGWYRDDYADGAGIDLFYIDRVKLTGHGKNVDLALVRRLCNTLGSGCQIAVIPYANADEAAQWARIGFAISTPGRPSGLMHLKLGYRHADVVDATGSGEYEVMPALGAFMPARSVAN